MKKKFITAFKLIYLYDLVIKLNGHQIKISIILDSILDFLSNYTSIFFTKYLYKKEPKLFNNNNMKVYTGECIWTAQPDLGFHHFMIIIFIYMYKYRSGMQ